MEASGPGDGDCRTCPFMLLLLAAILGGCTSRAIRRHHAATTMPGSTRRWSRSGSRFAAATASRGSASRAARSSPGLRVRVTTDGQVANLPIVVSQTGVTPANQPYASRMAEAAIEAVMRCAPLRLPESAFHRRLERIRTDLQPGRGGLESKPGLATRSCGCPRTTSSTAWPSATRAVPARRGKETKATAVTAF